MHHFEFFYCDPWKESIFSISYSLFEENPFVAIVEMPIVYRQDFFPLKVCDIECQILPVFLTRQLPMEQY